MGKLSKTLTILGGSILVGVAYSPWKDKKDLEEENEELGTDKIKEEKDEEEKLKKEPKKTRERKKAEETKNDNLAEDFLNNLDMTMRKG